MARQTVTERVDARWAWGALAVFLVRSLVLTRLTSTTRHPASGPVISTFGGLLFAMAIVVVIGLAGRRLWGSVALAAWGVVGLLANVTRAAGIGPNVRPVTTAINVMANAAMVVLGVAMWRDAPRRARRSTARAKRDLRSRLPLVGLAVMSALIPDAPLGGLVLTRPLLVGIFVAAVVSRFRVSATRAVGWGSAPATLLNSAGIAALHGRSVGFRAVACVIVGATYLGFAALGARIGLRRRARTSRAG